jgi:translocation and assembly module TamA
MLTKLKQLLLLICCIPLLSATKLITIQIRGIQGSVLLNVERRLTELYQDKSIFNEPIDALQLQVEKAMYPFGYFQPHVEIMPGNKNTGLRLHINPGPQMRITTLSVSVKGEGATNLKIKQTIKDLPIKAGQPLNNTKYEDAKEKLSNVAENQGYLHAAFEKAEILIDKQQYTAKITLLFNTGPQYYFGQIRFDPTYISPALLRRYLPFNYGQPYSTEQILALNTNLAASGYFSSVNVKPIVAKEQHVPININLQPSKRITYSLGAGYGTDTGPRGLAGLHIIPVNRSGHKFNAIAQGSLQENALQAQYLIPGRNPVIDNYGISGGATNLNYNSGDSNAVLLSLTQQHVLTNYQRILSINALHDRYNYTGNGKLSESLF